MHPYKNLPDHAFWSRAVSRGWEPTSLISRGVRLIDDSDKVASAGSCFAINIVQYLERLGYQYVRVGNKSALQNERYGYGQYSADYGNIYTAKQMLQLLQRAIGVFQPAEDRWYHEGLVIDPFRPGLSFPAESDDEFNILTAAHLARTRECIKQATVFIFTVGLTEAWVSSEDGAVFPTCPGVIAGLFDSRRHIFKNFSASEVIDDLTAMVAALRSINPSLKIILTVSPVPLVATATGRHVLLASVYSKSVLCVACNHIAQTLSDVVYFPAYELITGPQAPDFFEHDRRSVNAAGVDLAMSVFFQNAGRPLQLPVSADLARGVSAASQLSSAIATIECEEVMMDRQPSEEI